MRLRSIGQRVTAELRRSSTRFRVLAYAGGLFAGGIACLVITPGVTQVPERHWTLPFVVLAVAFALAEATALHVEIRKESHSLSLSGIPMMFGLLFTSPLLLALAYVAGAAPTMRWIRKSDVTKTTWNCSLFFAEAAVAALVVRTALGTDLPSNALEWCIPLAAVLVAELMSLLAVPLVIMAVDVKFRPNLFADVGQSQILAALAGTFTVIAVAVATDSPAMLVFAAIPFAGVGFLLRVHGRLGQRYAELQKLHRFTRALAHERGARTIDTGLNELAEIMRATGAWVLVLPGDDQSGATGRALIDDTLRDVDPQPIVASLLDVLDGRVATIAATDPRTAARRALRLLGAREILAAPILGEAGRQGVLVVSDRLGMHDSFTTEEVGLFGSLAGTFSARLTNDCLVEQLEIQAQHDALTGLANRLSFEVAVTSALTSPDARGVVAMVDLDRFKEINDSLGHDAGDKLLIQVAERLQATARASDLVARFGGDEFAIMLTARTPQAAAELAERIERLHAKVVEPIQLDGITFEIGASLGVAAWPERGHDSNTLLRRADTAMYHAKRNQLGTVWYSPDLDADAPRRLDLYLSVRAALESGNIYVHYQPKASIVDGRITGAETLVRWAHPSYGPISPSEFVPLIEQAGLTGRLTRFVARAAINAAAQLAADGHDLTFSINLTARDLLDRSLPNDLAELLRDAQVEPGHLEIEITEGAMVVDFETSISVLNQIRDLGVRVAIDDFGTGYASLQHLHRLPVDQLKIDRSFIARLATDASAVPIVQASVSLARDLGLTTVAEGVEDDFTLRMVSGLGCQQIQGFMLSRPMDLGTLATWLEGWDPDRLLNRLIDYSITSADRSPTTEPSTMRRPR